MLVDWWRVSSSIPGHGFCTAAARLVFCVSSIVKARALERAYSRTWSGNSTAISSLRNARLPAATFKSLPLSARNLSRSRFWFNTSLLLNLYAGGAS
ncbi:hypothetical protein AC579_10000 [Pseudocercospora musae]|uniref:Uncharacterized protein n=1 Tax=Pseudocercospora musae TaxID=113226 RepID=A0A139I4R8_9PEZI|nr:hypothetical protein AC579_10000 [Pseudocercospora musae]